MSPVRVTLRRTVGRARSLYTTAFAVGGFLTATALLFAFGLQRAEGGTLSLAAVWCASVSPVLPVLAALLGMDSWSDERATGRIEILLATAVRERELVLGKLLGVWVMLIGAVALSLLTMLLLLFVHAPDLVPAPHALSFVPAFLALSLQGLVWAAVSTAASACFAHAAAAACAATALTVALPRALWAAWIAWMPGGTAAGEMPLDAHAVDMAGGLVSTGTLAAYLLAAAAVYFVTVRLVSGFRLTGRGGRSARGILTLTSLLCLATAALAAAFAWRTDVTLDLPVGAGETRFSPRTRGILSETRGDLRVTCLMQRRDPRFRSTGHFLRAFRREAANLGGSRIELAFVDPNWNLGAAERLVRLGAVSGSVVIERGRRSAVLPVDASFDERLFASAVQRLAAAATRRDICWTTGHGETRVEDYGEWGLSDIGRELARDGYRNVTIDLADTSGIPADCALIVVAGAKDDFSRTETSRLDAYLKQGGRLLVLTSSPDSGGVAALLPQWGLRAENATFPSAKTLTGTDVIVSDFAAHPVSSPLVGSRIVLERPVSFAASAAAEAGAGADRLEFAPLAKAAGNPVAACVTRGGALGADLALRPTRIVAIGDASFVLNAQLAVRANANRDFFRNCVAYLAGSDAATASGLGADRLVTGLDRRARLRYLIDAGFAFPASVFLILVAVAFYRRRRA